MSLGHSLLRKHSTLNMAPNTECSPYAHKYFAQYEFRTFGNTLVKMAQSYLKESTLSFIAYSYFYEITLLKEKLLYFAKSI